MAILKIVNPIESLVTNPTDAPMRYSWGTSGSAKLCVAPKATVRLPYDVFTQSDACGKNNFTHDLEQGRVSLKYVTHGVDCERSDVAKPVTLPKAPEAARPNDDAKTLVEPAPVPMSEHKVGASQQTVLADDYDAIGRIGSVDSYKPERVSPMDDEAPVTRDLAERITLDDWDGALVEEQAAVEAAQGPVEVPKEAEQLHAERSQTRAKKGRR